jgi:hypothetical protein
MRDPAIWFPMPTATQLQYVGAENRKRMSPVVRLSAVIVNVKLFDAPPKSVTNVAAFGGGRFLGAEFTCLSSRSPKETHVASSSCVSRVL